MIQYTKSPIIKHRQARMRAFFTTLGCISLNRFSENLRTNKPSKNSHQTGSHGRKWNQRVIRMTNRLLFYLPRWERWVVCKVRQMSRQVSKSRGRTLGQWSSGHKLWSGKRGGSFLALHTSTSNSRLNSNTEGKSFAVKHRISCQQK